MSSLIRAITRSGVLWAVPVLILIEFVNINQARVPLIHWTTTIELINGAYVLLLPLCAGLACALTVPVVRRREMVRSLPDGGLRALTHPVVMVAGTFMLVHLLTTLVIVAIGLDDISGIPNLLPLVGISAAFIAASAFGALVATLSPSLVTAPFCVVVIYMLEIFVPRTGADLFLDFGGATVVLLGLAVRGDVVLSQAAWLFAATVFLLFLAVHGRRLAYARTASATLVVLLCGATWLLASRGEARFQAASVEWVCSQGIPEVCVAEPYEDELEPYSTQVVHSHHELQELGIRGLPSRYRQGVGGDEAAEHADGHFGISRELSREQVALDVVVSNFACSPRWTGKELDLAETVVAYLVKDEGEELYPGGPVASRTRAQNAFRRLDCS